MKNLNLQISTMAVLVALICRSSEVLAFTNETSQFDAKTIRELEIENSSGWIKIVKTTNDNATVTSQKVKFSDQCKMTVENTGGTLSIDLVPTAGLSNQDCEVNWTVSVPEFVDIEIENGTGNVDITGTKGPIEYKVGRGDVNISAQVEKLEGKMGSGSLDAKGLTGSADLSTGAGNMNLTYASAPQSGKLEIKSGSGNANVFLPSNAEIFAETTSVLGSTSNEFLNATHPKFRVSFKTGSGDLNIKKNQ